MEIPKGGCLWCDGEALVSRRGVAVCPECHHVWVLTGSECDSLWARHLGSRPRPQALLRGLPGTPIPSSPVG
mgnify:CR=1 FL=1